VLAPVLALVLALDRREALRRRLTSAAAVLAVSVVVVAGYLALASAGPYAGLFDMSGWHLYARVAPTADCRTFNPPRDTRFLCQSTPVAQRPGSYWYEWASDSPARQWFALPDGNDQLGRFARAWIAADPLAYLKVVVKDTLRDVDSSLGRDRIVSGNTTHEFAFGYRNADTEALLIRHYTPAYTGVAPVHASGQGLLDDYQRLARLRALEKLLLIAFALVGFWAARGTVRQAIALLGLSALAIMVLPAATLSYDIRFSLPPMLPITAAAVIGGWALWRRRAVR